MINAEHLLNKSTTSLLIYYEFSFYPHNKVWVKQKTSLNASKNAFNNKT